MTLEQTLKQIRKNKFWRDRKNIIYFSVGLLFNIFIWLYLYFTMRGMRGAVPIHYNFLFGVDQIGPWTGLLKIPLLGLIIFIVNSFLIYKFYLKEDKFFINLLSISTVILQIILLIAVILIINL